MLLLPRSLPSLFFLCLLLPHAFSRYSILSSTAVTLDVKTICSKCTFTERCLSTAKLQIGKPVDVVALLKLKMQALENRILAAKAEVESHAKDPNVHPRTKSDLLPRCTSRFQDALKHVEMQSKALDRGEQLTTNAFVSITDESTDCTEVFAMNHEACPLAMDVEIKAIVEIATNCMDIASHFMGATLKKSKHHGDGSHKVASSPAPKPKPNTASDSKGPSAAQTAAATPPPVASAAKTAAATVPPPVASAAKTAAATVPPPVASAAKTAAATPPPVASSFSSSRVVGDGGHKGSNAPSPIPKPTSENMQRPSAVKTTATTPPPVAASSSYSSGAVGVKAICAKAINPNRCMALFQAAAGAGAKLESANAVTVLQHVLKAIIDAASAGSAKASALDKDANSNDKAKAVLPNCVRLYQVCMADIERAVEAVAKNDLAQAKSILTAEIGLVDGCKKEAEKAGVALLVQAHQDEVNELLHHSLYIINWFWPSLKDLTESEAAYAGIKDMGSPGPEEAETEEEKKANDGKFVWDLRFSINDFGSK